MLTLNTTRRLALAHRQCVKIRVTNFLAKAGGVVDRAKNVPPIYSDHHASCGYGFTYRVRTYRGSQEIVCTLVPRLIRIGGVTDS